MKKLLLIYATLISLTLFGAYTSNKLEQSAAIPAALIMFVALVKFILVAFDYMDLRKANGVWKFSVVFLAVLAALVVGVFGGV